MRQSLLLSVSVATLAGCSPGLPAMLPDPDIDPGLGDVVLMTWTTRSAEGLLGYALDPELVQVDAVRRVATGAPRWVPTHQRLSFVVAAAGNAQAAAGLHGLSAQAGAHRVTHVAYDVLVSGYLELPGDSLRYDPRSHCCLGGEAMAECAHGYVGRLMWGTGRAQYLVKVETSAEVSAAELVRARGGTRFRRVNETRFQDTFFAYEVAPTRALCRLVAPTEELEPITVKAPSNCWVQAFSADGSRQAYAFSLPDPELCRKVAAHHCSLVEQRIDCRVSYAEGTRVTPLELDPASFMPVSGLESSKQEEPAAQKTPAKPVVNGTAR
ncbi:MAG: hypothetical protein JW940_16025 [Polyangiaceae bacterium]|nr:hypothetical protein [Polyangiaceae bacterium]